MILPELSRRAHGTTGPLVVVVHGGPGAPGSLGDLGAVLGSWCRVVEPYQRSSGSVPLTIDQHVADLQAVVASLGEPVVVVGHSWGAMLALAHAALHGAHLAGVVLVGCGTFDEASRAVFVETIEARTPPPLAARLQELIETTPDADHRLAQLGRLLVPLYSHELLAEPMEPVRVDARGYDESWQDMLQAQREGRFPAAFASIGCPVTMIHGEDDPHPGSLVRASLQEWIPHLDYVSLPRAGHYPWLEAHASERFFEVVMERARRWMAGLSSTP